MKATNLSHYKLNKDLSACPVLKLSDPPLGLSLCLKLTCIPLLMFQLYNTRSLISCFAPLEIPTTEFLFEEVYYTCAIDQ
jgi:hypothetical protein